MRWKVEIRDLVGSQRLLRETLEPLSIGVSEAEGKIFIAGERFEGMRSAAEVHADAIEVSTIIDEIAAADPEIKLGFGVGVVVVEGPDGAPRTHTVVQLVSPAHITARAGIVRVSVTSGPVSETERARLEEEQREREYQRVKRKVIARVVSAARNPRALQVQRLLAAELMPLTMGHIVALIQADIGGAIKDLVKPSTRLERLERSINHSAVYGKDARHIVPDKEPPARPMEIDEARVFIRELADRWFERIAGI